MNITANCTTSMKVAKILMGNCRSNSHFKEHPLTASKIRKKPNFHHSKAYPLKISRLASYDASTHYVPQKATVKQRSAILLPSSLKRSFFKEQKIHS